ncbi:hypothetical protein SAMN05421504_104411 [Amycolatopsis xylanica]|uniref:Excreted virulence factor EspC, type VII ESX diderm n=1 Tax=Amycolatopsis xylanica TaxID=589385 RepID=A0A1H3GUS2_9PSEU|nr:hypothetical protein [Amycolatopsis xylanica]SDY07082.1 hypothetical protein SAMN05421504_104411 [Amycolatopsis xylanica]
MAEEFFLDPDGVGQATRDLKASGRRLSGAFTKLTETLDRHDGCWGDDDIGKGFEKSYRQPSTEARTGIKDTVDGILGVCDEVDKSVEIFESVDQENAERIDKSA